MFSRIQSPSSINTYRQCPRKYYYQYIAKLETRPSIHLVRGKIVHSVLEDFFKINVNHISASNYDFEFKIVIADLIHRHWQASHDELSLLGLPHDRVHEYLIESKEMVQFWLLDFLHILKEELATCDLATAFRSLTPETEVHLLSERHRVQGYVDAIYRRAGKVVLIDYKTNAQAVMTDSHRLQLAIYAMLYSEAFNQVPDAVGIHFLRFVQKRLLVTDQLIKWAENECRLVHELTSTGQITEYPRKESRLCAWSSGQCDFYDECKKK